MTTVSGLDRQSSNTYTALDFNRVLDVLSKMPPYPTIKSDNRQAAWSYEQYTRLQKDENLTTVSKPYFLYVWLCSKSIRGKNVDMRLYRFFSTEDVKVESLSYREFTQMFVERVRNKLLLDVYYRCSLESNVFFPYPISLRWLLDMFKLEYREDYYVLSENRRLTIKTKPRLMEPETKVIRKDKAVESNCLNMHRRSSVLVVTNSMANIKSKDCDMHLDHITKMCSYVGYKNVQHVRLLHKFFFPNREINFLQLESYLDTQCIAYSRVQGRRHIRVDSLIEGCDCEIVEEPLESNKCYYFKDYEIYRLKGEYILQIRVSSTKDRSYIQEKISELCSLLDTSILQDYIDPMTLDNLPIAKLRASNSNIFTCLYCRKASPQIQPVVISKCEIDRELAKGKMILIFDGRYYTTKDEPNKGQAFIGMINKFGDYDPTKPYVPIIRTYKKFHIASKEFKELKAYLLRHSPNPNEGTISREDILLPRHLESWYDIKISNPDSKVSSVHSKKTSVSGSSKTSTGEVPDYIKSLLGTDNVVRVINSKSKCSLLTSFNVDQNDFMNYCKTHMNRYMDMSTLSWEDVFKDFCTDELDHRIYGKALEDFTGYNIIVFSRDGLVPYKQSNCSKDKYVLLYTLKSFMYDAILIGEANYPISKLSMLKEIHNRNNLDPINIPLVSERRPIDYVKVHIALVSYLYRWCKDSNISVTCRLVDKGRCKEIVERVYRNTTYYEAIVKCSIQGFIDTLVTSYRSHYSIKLCNAIVFETLMGVVYGYSLTEVVCLSPVDMGKYHPWSFTLEECLYFSVDCYLLNKDEEVQILHTVD